MVIMPHDTRVPTPEYTRVPVRVEDANSRKCVCEAYHWRIAIVKKRVYCSSAHRYSMVCHSISYVVGANISESPSSTCNLRESSCEENVSCLSDTVFWETNHSPLGWRERI